MFSVYEINPWTVQKAQIKRFEINFKKAGILHQQNH